MAPEEAAWNRMYLKTSACTHVFAADLLLRQLNLNQRSDGGEQFPPRPALHAAVLLYVLLDAADSQILDLTHKHGDTRKKKLK